MADLHVCNSCGGVEECKPSCRWYKPKCEHGCYPEHCAPCSYARGRADERADACAFLDEKATRYGDHQRERGGADACSAGAAQLRRGEHLGAATRRG
jgi:hypothetical protein